MQQLKQLSEEKQIKFVEVSAKTGHNVEMLVESVAELCARQE